MYIDKTEIIEVLSDIIEANQLPPDQIEKAIWAKVELQKAVTIEDIIKVVFILAQFIAPILNMIDII
ncbi:hypothetical protein [Aegicerativicinus sediminis]|uniref:hypothetical protein n=1 Tax=Aegicerativicinus sediminis TaxID=2893202 RepID=UPI001E61BE7D|nr:hypothetical protein [Aegicerativicinus sediminis]